MTVYLRPVTDLVLLDTFTKEVKSGIRPAILSYKSLADISHLAPHHVTYTWPADKESLSRNILLDCFSS